MIGHDEAMAQLAEAQQEIGGLRAQVAHLEPLVAAHCNRADALLQRVRFLAVQLSTRTGCSVEWWIAAADDLADSLGGDPT